jgi:hypothetical protein
MGFYLATPYLLLKRRRRRMAYAFLAAGVLYGAAMGAARMMAGGHFLSDVVWAGGITWLTALAVHHLLRLDREPAAVDARALERDPRRARLAAVLGGGALALLTTAVLLATPYVSSKRFSRSAEEVAASGARVLEVSLDEATVSVEGGSGLDASYEVQAFGFPTSRLGFAWRDVGDAEILSIDRLGWFTERRTTVKLRLPQGGEKPLRVRLGKGKLALDLRAFAPGARLDVEVGEGEVRVLGASALDGSDRVRVRVGRGEVVRDAG